MTTMNSEPDTRPRSLRMKMLHIQNLIKEAAAVKGKTINASDDEDDEEKKFNQDNKMGD